MYCFDMKWVYRLIPGSKRRPRERGILEETQALPQELQDMIYEYLLLPTPQTVNLTEKQLAVARQHVQRYFTNGEYTLGAVTLMKTFKISVFGTPCVGKQQLINRFCQHPFRAEATGFQNPTYDCRDFSWYTTLERRCQVHWELLHLEKRHDQWRALIAAMTELVDQAKYEYPKACLLVYSVTNRRSFSELKELYKTWMALQRRQLCSSRGTRRVAIFVVASKVDLYSSHGQVSHEEGEEFAAAIGAPFLQTSSKDNYGTTSEDAEKILQHMFYQAAVNERAMKHSRQETKEQLLITRSKKF